MNVQLIVYPQDFNGLNSLSGLGSECVVDGINFTTVGTSSSSTSVSGSLPQAYISATAFTVNTWFRFSGVATAVSESSGNIVFVTDSGILQKLSNLTIGATYNFTIEFNALNAAGIKFYHYSGNTQQSVTTITGTTTQTFNFTAQSTSDIVVLYGLGATQVASLSVKRAASSILNLSNGQEILDLYEDEDIPLTLSVDEFKNAAEQVKSYSKAFNLPATKNNNRIFHNLFEITRSSDGDKFFNPYVKTQCVLKQDGFTIFEGYLRLIDISDKQGEISYNVNLYSEVIALADTLENKKFSDLSFVELEHDYNKTNIKNSWNDGGTGITYTNPSTSGFRDANDTVKYPFCDWTHQWLIANNPNGNLGPTHNNPQLVTLQQAFRPFIQIKYLIDIIFAQSNFPFSYTSTFFNTTDFKKLYMDFNWGADDNPIQQTGDTYECFYFYNLGDGSATNYATASFDVMNLSYNIPLVGGLTPPNYSDTNDFITSTANNESYDIQYIYGIENTDTVSREIECRWLYNNTPIDNTPAIGAANVITIAAGGTFYYQGSFSIVMTTAGDTLKAQFRTDSGTASKVRQLHTAFPLNGASVIFNTGISSVTSATILQTLRGELGQWEFLKGIMTMFNLVTVPDKSDPNNILIEPYNDMFLENADTSELLWTDKVDIEEIKLMPLTDLKQKTIFKFVEDDDDWAFKNYKIEVENHLYGSQMFDAEISANGLETVLSGEEEIVAEPFAATVPKPLDYQFSNFIVPSIYSYNPENDTSEGFDNSPRIMYNNGKKTLPGGLTYYIPAFNGLSSENQASFLQFSHLSEIPTTSSTLDFHFGICQLIQPIGSPTVNNLFMTYWLPYYNELYNPDTRIMTLKVNLLAGDINTFKFYDTILIKNRKFRVNKIEYKPNDLSTVEFILIP